MGVGACYITIKGPSYNPKQREREREREREKEGGEEGQKRGRGEGERCDILFVCVHVYRDF